MCMAVIKHSSNAMYSYFIGVNREEKIENQWENWGRHWCQYPDCYGCLDIASGGTWLAINDNSIVAVLINREIDINSGTKSRAFLLLESLSEAKTAQSVISLISNRDLFDYRPFNLIAVDKCSALCLSSTSGEYHVSDCFDSGYMMVNRSEPNDFEQVRIKSNHPKFIAAKDPNPMSGEYNDWQKILSEQCYTVSPDTEFTMTLVSDRWRTLSSSIISIPVNGDFPTIKDFEVTYEQLAS